MIVTNPQTVMNERVPTSYDNTLRVYKARAFANCESGDDRLQVRVLPFMADIPQNEDDNLPKYAMFFKGQVIKVNTEKDDGVGDLLWILAIPDFTFGYILGPCNSTLGISEDASIGAWDYDGAKTTMMMLGASVADFDYKNIYVDVTNSTGTYIEFHNIKSGEKWMITSKGDVIHMAPSRVFIQASAGTGKGDSRSSIELTPTKVNVSTDLFNVDAKNVVLAKHNMKLLGSLSDAPISCDGVNIQPISNIFV